MQARTARDRAPAELGDGGPRRVEEGNPESELRALHRARSMIRRLCREYRLDHMWTLTYRGEGCHDRRRLKRDLEAFARALKRRTRTKRYPDGRFWLGVPELHPDGHGWHVHVALAGFVHWRKLVASWPHGHVETPKDKDGQPFAGRLGRCNPNKVARYLADYVGKSLGEGREYLGEHRYFRPKGAALTVVKGVALSYVQAWGVAVAFFGGEVPRFQWESESLTDWQGPPVMWLDFWARK